MCRTYFPPIHHLSEKVSARIRTVNLVMADRTVVVTGRRLIVRCLRRSAFHIGNAAVAFHTELADIVAFQKFRVA